MERWVAAACNKQRASERAIKFIDINRIMQAQQQHSAKLKSKSSKSLLSKLQV